MKIMMVIIVGAMAMVWMLVGAPVGDAALTCGTVASALAPCLTYVTVAWPLPAACCIGVRALNDQASTTPDRQTACACLKSAAATISGLNYGLVAGLPAKCDVNIPYNISSTTDCSKVR